MYVILFRSIFRAIKGEGQGLGSFKENWQCGIGWANRKVEE
jgi:hypothetical protein